MNQSEILDQIENLKSKDIRTREQARYLLANAGSEATPFLADLLHSPHANERLEAARILGRLGDNSVADELVEALLDESLNVHWAASEALIEFGSGAILPLLAGLTKHFDSPRFRQGAYHILHMFERLGYLESHIRKVLDALRDVEPEASVPWAAEHAIDALTVGQG